MVAVLMCILKAVMTLVLVATVFGVLSAEATELTGVARVVDGDTLVIGATRIRLEGVDAPETDQFCLTATGARWTCGAEARDQLAAYLGWSDNFLHFDRRRRVPPCARQVQIDE